MKVETVRLPNGISTVFGPVSCRRADIGRTGRTVHDMSGLNQFLSLVQHGRYPRKYAVLGDGTYGMDFECVRLLQGSLSSCSNDRVYEGM